MPSTSDRSRREPQEFAPDSRPGAANFVYCKGCGTQLEDRSRLQKPKAVIDAMMCVPCQEEHGHTLMPKPGAPTYCYRCGTLEEITMEPATTPITHHVCARCLPEKAARYRAGDFAEPLRTPVEAETK